MDYYYLYFDGDIVSVKMAVRSPHPYHLYGSNIPNLYNKKMTCNDLLKIIRANPDVRYKIPDELSKQLN